MTDSFTKPPHASREAFLLNIERSFRKIMEFLQKGENLRVCEVFRCGKLATVRHGWEGDETYLCDACSQRVNYAHGESSPQEDLPYAAAFRGMESAPAPDSIPDPTLELRLLLNAREKELQELRAAANDFVAGLCQTLDASWIYECDRWGQDGCQGLSTKSYGDTTLCDACADAVVEEGGGPSEKDFRDYPHAAPLRRLMGGVKS